MTIGRAAAVYDAWTPALASVLCAAGAIVALELAAALMPADDAPVELVWLLGMLLAGSAVAAAGLAASAVALAVRARGGGLPSVLPSVALIGLALLMVAVAMLMHPPFGSGSGVG